MRYRLRTLMVAVSIVPPIIAIVAYTGGHFVVPAALYLACVVLVKRFILADDATLLRE